MRPPHRQPDTAKPPRHEPGRAGALLPLVQSTTCFGLHLVTGSMAGSTRPAPAPAGDRSRAPSDADSPPLRLPSRQRRAGPPPGAVPPAGRALCPGRCRRAASWGPRGFSREGEGEKVSGDSAFKLLLPFRLCLPPPPPRLTARKVRKSQKHEIT